MGRSRSIVAKPRAVVGLDVGKFSHWAYGIDADGEVVVDSPVENREGALDALFAAADPGTTVVVDRKLDRIPAQAIESACETALAANAAPSYKTVNTIIRNRAEAREAQKPAGGNPWALRRFK